MTVQPFFSRAAGFKQLSFFSPAKINLFFRVLYKRDDGFHEIASLYQAIDLGDWIQIGKAQQDHFTCSDATLAMCDNNLVVKALYLFRDKTRILDPVMIHLDKKIPREAGLGGGSSNAATTLWALYTLFGLKPCLSELQELGACLGSDVPFFFSSGTSYCTGRGEKLQDVMLQEVFYDTSFWIAKPSFGLSTPAVYKACNPSLLFHRDPQESLQSFISSDPVFYNDLEEAAFSLCPKLSKVKNTILASGFTQVIMSGSGSSFFCLGPVVSPPHIENVTWYPVKPWRGRIQMQTG